MERNERNRSIVIAALVLTITVLHYSTAPQRVEIHDIYRRLYYIPIILGGLWFGLRGGLLTSLAVSAFYLPHILLQWRSHPTTNLEQYLEVILYNVIGALTGFLAAREQLQKIRYQQAASRLEDSYAKLREQADLILEIEEQLRRADRLTALGELAAGMAHEFRNPLGSIRGTAEILQDGIDPDDPRAEFSRILVKEVDRLNRVVQDFLDFARPASDDQASNERVDVNESLRDILFLVQQPAAKSGVTVRFEAGSLPPFAGQREQLKQAFLNLILNAIQAMPSGGALTVTTQMEGRNFRIDFADTGQGIAPADLSRIFNPFFTTRHDGTGLGLAITHRIIQGHGGRIDVVSKVGEGTTITLRLPAAD
ncbi:MAG TPA: ATP-binding protein [Desulfuromonadales bacterium]|nr:ATP-binding protein [Desulfuromonadales bacterium]